MFLIRRLSFFFLLLHFTAVAQTRPDSSLVFKSSRTINLSAKTDTLQLDSLSIVPGTFHLYRGTQEIDSTFFQLDAAKSQLVLTKNAPHDSLRANFQVFPFSLTQARYHKDAGLLTARKNQAYNPFVYVPGAIKTEDPFAFTGLNKSGSLSRGISFGNNRDVSVSSNLNLQLSGKITDNIELQLVATDDNLPLQASGTTQQLQEFDKVFIQLSDPHTKLVAGDFFLNKPEAYFMTFSKRAQGLTINNEQVLAIDSGKPSSTLQLTGSVAVSKGKFARNTIQGIEGNQGPYRLRGAENELFIVILAGTERVYVDGQLLKRGQENEYIIDYNTAEITFTARQLITKDKRIVVEFQYSDRNYTRSLVHAGANYRTKTYGLQFNVYSEQDSKNQPLQQVLSDDDKRKLISIGDTLQAAFASGADSVAFSGDLVLYRKMDTLVNSITYTDVYVYSTDPDTAHWRLSFSNVGVQRGNYIQVNSSANGKVFQWVAPVNGVPQGDYEPVILLITPKKKQMLTAGFDTRLGKHSKLEGEAAYSNNDLNTFSPINSSDDAGFGAHVRLEDVRTSHDSLKRDALRSFVEYEWAGKTFSPIERYRPVEFERDWNLGFNPAPRTASADQHLISAGTNWSRKNFGSLSYKFGLFSEDTAFQGMRHAGGAQIRKQNWLVNANAAFVQTSGSAGRGQLLRQNVKVTKRIKKFEFGLEEAQEQSLNRLAGTEVLNATSFGFFEWQASAGTGDTTKRHITVFYKQRRDEVPDSTLLKRIAFAENIGASLDLLGKPDRTLRTTITWRKLQITDQSLTSQQPDNTLLGRTELGLRFWKGVLVSNTFYEAGSGLELKKEFSYIEVSAGQGNYTWTDYNGNGVKELNEFEVAVFTDQATYIRVFTPTNEYVKVYTNQFSQSLQVRPAVRWANAKGLKGVVARFTDQAALRIDRKTGSSDAFYALTPLLADAGDTALVTLNASIRNTISFNQLSSKFGMDFTWQEVRGKNLLTSGIESRGQILRETRVRWNINRSFGLNVAYRDGVKSNGSEFFSTRNYRVHFVETEPALSFQPGTTFRLTAKYRYSDKRNAEDLGGEKAFFNKASGEFKINRAAKGSVLGELSWINIQYTGGISSAVAYDMLEGLKPGQNFVWRLNWQRALGGSLQLTIGYEGRKTPNVNTIHTGTAQIRAVF